MIIKTNQNTIIILFIHKTTNHQNRACKQYYTRKYFNYFYRRKQFTSEKHSRNVKRNNRQNKNELNANYFIVKSMGYYQQWTVIDRMRSIVSVSRESIEKLHLSVFSHFVFFGVHKAVQIF